MKYTQINQTLYTKLIIGICMLIQCLTGPTIHAIEFKYPTIEEQIYGPYLNDHPITISTQNIDQLLPKEKCDSKQIIAQNNTYNQPGLFKLQLNQKENDNIIKCAYNNNKTALQLLENLVYTPQLNQKRSTENRIIRDIIYHPKYIKKNNNKLSKYH